MHRNLMAIVITSIVLVYLQPALANEGDLTLLQGKWQMITTSNGVEQRVVKTVDGPTETVEVYVDGKMVQKHHVDFELKAFGPAKVFAWKNGRIAAGPHAGKKLPDGRFIYRIEDRTWTAVHGMLHGDKKRVMREVYQRVGDPPKPPAS